MITIRFLLWVVLSAVAFIGGLIVLALSFQTPSLDYGWFNAVFMFGLWVLVAVGLKQSLVDERGEPEPRASAHALVTTLDYRRR